MERGMKETYINFIEKHSGLTREKRHLVETLHGSQFHEREVSLIEKRLLEYIEVVSFQKGNGAHLTSESFENLFNTILDIYIKKKYIILSIFKKNFNTLSVRFSTDGTSDVYRSAHKENFEVLSFQFLDVLHPQHPKHVYPIAIIKGKESTKSLDELIGALNLLTFFESLSSKKVTIDTQVVGFEIFFSADWMGHVAEASLSLPTIMNNKKPCCGWCLQGRLGLTDDFKQQKCNHPIVNKKIGVFQLLPKNKLYCWGHAVARLLTNALNAFYDLFPMYSRQKSSFRNDISLILGKWENGWSIVWSEAKLFLLTLNWKHQDIQRNFSNMTDLFYLNNCGNHKYYSVSELFHLMMEILTIFLVFAYLRWPSTCDFFYLSRTQKAFQWAWRMLQTKLVPTTHFMMEHAFELAQEIMELLITLSMKELKKNMKAQRLMHAILLKDFWNATLRTDM
jgi:hypothetical protein